MADLLPVDTDSPAVADLARPADGRYTPSVAELVRQAAAVEHLAQAAAKAKRAPRDYVQRGLDLEWHHQLDDPAVPYSPYLQRGGQS